MNFNRNSSRRALSALRQKRCVSTKGGFLRQLNGEVSKTKGYCWRTSFTPYKAEISPSLRTFKKPIFKLFLVHEQLGVSPLSTCGSSSEAGSQGRPGANHDRHGLVFCSHLGENRDVTTVEHRRDAHEHLQYPPGRDRAGGEYASRPSRDHHGGSYRPAPPRHRHRRWRGCAARPCAGYPDPEGDPPGRASSSRTAGSRR
jgi:hypothetical protein